MTNSPQSCSADSAAQLLPCPFCGGEANHYENWVDHERKWSVCCGDCTANLDVCEDTKPEATMRWNSRTDDVAQQAPEGWRLVPVDPTTAQHIAAMEFALAHMKAHGVTSLSPFQDYPPLRETTAGMYRAMVGAAQPPAAPGHTDLMVTPESIDAFLDANPPPHECSSADTASERRNIAIFGHGFFGVDIGTLGDVPAVFITPNETPGTVGEKIPLELQGPLELESLPDHWIALTFPTRERCKEVADALVGSKMEKWTRDEPQALVGWEFVSKDGEHGILTKNHEHAREWVRRGHEARPVVYSSPLPRPELGAGK